MTTHDDELRRLEKATTPGPWEFVPAGIIAPKRWVIYWSDQPSQIEDLLVDAPFIAAARNALPHLLDERDALRAELVEARRLLAWALTPKFDHETDAWTADIRAFLARGKKEST